MSLLYPETAARVLASLQPAIDERERIRAVGLRAQAELDRITAGIDAPEDGGYAIRLNTALRDAAFRIVADMTPIEDLT